MKHQRDLYALDALYGIYTTAEHFDVWLHHDIYNYIYIYIYIHVYIQAFKKPYGFKVMAILVGVEPGTSAPKHTNKQISFICLFIR